MASKLCTRKDFERINESKIYDQVYGDNETKKYMICLDFEKNKDKIKFL